MSGINLQNTKTILRSLINSAPYGLSIDDLDREYQMEAGRRIPFVELGYSRLYDFLQSINETLLIKTHPSGCHQVFAIQSAKSAHINTFVQEQKKQQGKKVKRTKNPIPMNQNTTRWHSNRSTDQIHSFYESNQPMPGSAQHQRAAQARFHQTNFGKPLSSGASSLCFGSNQSESKSFDDIRDITLSMLTTSIRPKAVDPATTPRKFNPPKCVIEALPSVQCVAAPPIEELPVQQVLAHYANRIALARFPDNLKEGALLGVYVSEINSPGKFWFHIQTASQPLENLMLAIDTRYRAMEPTDHQVHTIHMVPGRVCAALYEGSWHRAEVVRVQAHRKTALVHFIDYGTTTDVPFASIKYLLRDFGNLPCQVYRGCLDYIQPAGGRRRWCRDSSYAFLALAYDVMLFAKVTAIETKDRSVRMLLINTQHDDDVQINVEMIDRGFAEVSSDPIRGSSNENNSNAYGPTFDQLESGAYPSFRAVGLMLAEGVDIEAIRLSSPDDSGIERVRDRFLVWEQFHVTNPFRQLLLAV